MKTIHKKKPAVLCIIAICFSLAFLVVGVFFINYTGTINKEAIVQQIQTSTKHTDFAVDEFVREEFETLHAAAAMVEDQPLPLNNRLLSTLFSTLQGYDSYVYIGTTDMEGNLTWIGQDGIITQDLVTDFSSYEKVLSGNNVLTESRLDQRSGKIVNYLSIPIVTDGNIRGVLFAAMDTNKFRDIIDNSIYGGVGLAHIIDVDGNYVIKSQSPLVAGTGNHIFEIPEPLGTETEQQILDTMQRRESGHLEKSIYQQNRLIAYEPLNINDWYVFYVVPEEMVVPNMQLLRRGAIVITAIACGLFIFFILLLWWMTSRNRKDLEHLAFDDLLTGKPNLQKFILEARETLQANPNQTYMFAYMDINGFKYINDLFGRDVGDDFLRYWADYLDTHKLESDSFCRSSSDIFVGMGIWQDRRTLEQRFQHMAEHLSKFPKTADKGYKVTVSVGIYIANSQKENLTIEAMLDRANAAHKVAKATPGSNIEIYTNKLREQKLFETQLESKMDSALANDEFQVYLQPKIDIQHNNKIVGMEALVRWIDADGMLMPPGKFIPLFEKNGFIVEMDQYIFEQSCRLLHEHVIQKDDPPLVLSVNVSRLCLLQPNFLNIYVGIKDKYNIPDGLIELEFTESLIFENHELFQSLISGLQHHGFLCSIDDFGSGYSSLNILKSLHVDVLKLDGLFFDYGEDPIRGQELVRSIIAMAKALRMKTVAEGVDHVEQVKQLREMGCDIVQGYVFAKPMPVDDFVNFVYGWNGAPEI